MNRFSISCLVGLPYLEAYFNSNHAFLPSLWGRDNCAYQGYGPFRLSYPQDKVFDPNNCIYDVKALKERRQNLTRTGYLTKKRLVKSTKRVRHRTLNVGDLV